MKKSMMTHSIKNISTYIPVLAANKMITEDPLHSSVYGALTVMFIQHWTSLLDWKMTLEITSGKKQTLSNVISKIHWPQFNRMVFTRMGQYSTGYFITLFIANKINQYSQQTTETIDNDISKVRKKQGTLVPISKDDQQPLRLLETTKVHNTTLKRRTTLCHSNHRDEETPYYNKPC